MKLRLTEHALRLRLGRTDLRRLAERGCVEAEVRFPGGGRLVCGLYARPDVDRLTARLDGTTVAVHLPQAWVASWIDSDRVGFEGTEAAGRGQALHLLVEKDFRCLHRSDDTEDPFPHPQAHDAPETR